MASTKKRSKKTGLPPGSIVHIGNEKKHAVTMASIRFGAEKITEEKILSIDEISATPPSLETQWLHIDGIHDTALIDTLGKKLSIHSLILEDIVNTEQRPKFDNTPPFFYVVAKMLTFDDKTGKIHSEQASLLIENNRVITFVEDPGDVFDAVRARIRSGRMRNQGADFLFYSLLDSIIDNYFGIMEKMGDEIDRLENEIVLHPSSKSVVKVHHLKKDLLFLRKSIWPMRDVLSELWHSQSDLITEKTRLYIRDVYDHTLYMVDTLETYRDLIAGLMETYRAGLSQHMNEIMKVLTIISTLFMPLTFIVGLYGMNFKYMPELEWHFGYLFAWGTLILSGLSMYLFFRHKKWF